MALGPPFLAGRPAGLKQVQGPGLGRLRMVPQGPPFPRLPRDRGFVQGLSLRRLDLPLPLLPWLPSGEVMDPPARPCSAAGPRTNQHRMALAPLVKPPLAMHLATGRWPASRFRNSCSAASGDSPRGRASAMTVRHAAQRGRNVCPGSGKTPAAGSTTPDRRTPGRATSCHRPRDGRCYCAPPASPSSCHQCSTSRPKPRAITRSMT